MQRKIFKKHAQSPVHYSFYNRITEVPSINWKALGANKNPFFSVDYFKTLEDTLTKNTNFTYIVFFNTQNTAIGFAVTQLVTFNTQDFLNQQLPCIINEGAKSPLLKNLDGSVLVCGNLFSCGEHGFVFDKKQLPASEAYRHLSNALRDTRKMDNSEKPSFILVKEFWPESFKDSDPIKEQDFRELFIDVNMLLRMSPEWLSFEDYLNSMRTKFRTRAKKVLSNSKAISVKDFNESDIKNYHNKINQLYESVIENAHFKLSQLNADVFYGLKKTLKDQFLFKAYFLNDNLIGFATSIIQENSVEAFHVGFDYNYKKSHNIYQRMLYDYVDLAITQQVPRLHLGRTAETIKSCVGAQPVSMKLYIRHRNSISNTLLKPIAGMITPNDFEIRNPFKKETN